MTTLERLEAEAHHHAELSATAQDEVTRFWHSGIAYGIRESIFQLNLAQIAEDEENAQYHGQGTVDYTDIREEAHVSTSKPNYHE